MLHSTNWKSDLNHLQDTPLNPPTNYINELLHSPERSSLQQLSIRQRRSYSADGLALYEQPFQRAETDQMTIQLDIISSEGSSTVDGD